MEELSARLRDLAAGAAAPDDVLEPALRAVIEASRASAGALCLFDSRDEALRLAASVGLSDEGRRQLGTVRRGAVGAWYMPLYGLLNRRAYLLDSASRNRSLPPLVEPVAAVRTVACVPLCAGPAPVGSLVLVTRAPQSLTEDDVRVLERPMRELASLIERARRPAACADEGGRPETAKGRSVSELAPAVAELMASLAATERERDGLAAALEATAAERAQVQRAQEEVLAERAAALERLAARLADAEATAAAEGELALRWKRRHERIVGALRAAARREQRLREELEAATQSGADGSADLRQALAGAEAAVEALTHEGIAERERLQRELEVARAREQQANARQRRLEQALRALQAARAAAAATLATRLNALTAERDQLERALAALATEAARIPVETVVLPGPLEEESGEEAPSGASVDALRASSAPRIVVLDSDPAWEGVRLDGQELAVVRPGDDLAERLLSMAPRDIVANLAAPGALAALAALRAAGSTARFRGCLADAEARRGVALGTIEPVVRPLDHDRLLATLSLYAAAGSRVVTVGNEVDALLSLRQALARQGISVSMAWDARRAADLLATVRPDLVLVDLEHPPGVGYGIVSQLAAAEPVPTLVLVPGTQDAAAGFAAALADASPDLALPFEQLLAEVLGRPEAPPATRR